MKKFLVVFVALFVFSSILVGSPAFSQTRGDLLAQLNQAKEDYLRAKSVLDAQNRALRRQCNQDKQADYQRIEAEKIELRKTAEWNFLDAHLPERVAYRDELKAIDQSHRDFVKALDKKVTDAYVETEKQKKSLRKQLFNTRQEIEAKLKEMGQ
jgi:hypothetical protein